MSKDFIDTGVDFVAFLDGHCISIAIKAAGPLGLSANAETLREWGLRGWDIQTLDREAAFDALRTGFPYWAERGLQVPA